jgi:hypothetical protein
MGQGSLDFAERLASRIVLLGRDGGPPSAKGAEGWGTRFLVGSAGPPAEF